MLDHDQINHLKTGGSIIQKIVGQNTVGVHQIVLKIFMSEPANGG